MRSIPGALEARARASFERHAGTYPRRRPRAYAVPLHGAQRAADSETRRWLTAFGPDTGSAAVQAAVDAGEWGAERARLSVSGRFESAADLPRLFAPKGEPCRDAFLARAATLDIQNKGARTALRPYLAGGVLLTHTAVEFRSSGLGDDEDDDTDSGLYAQVGVDWWVSDRVSVGVNYRHVSEEPLDYAGNDLDGGALTLRLGMGFCKAMRGLDSAGNM